MIELNKTIKQIEERHAGDRDSLYDALESPIIQLVEGAYTSFEKASRLLASQAVQVHIMCAACLEAHINIRAQPMLAGALWDEFDKLSLPGKWLFFSHIRQSPLNPGAQPIQGIKELTTIRNRLVHFTTKRQKLFAAFELPAFIRDLKLTPEDCESSMKAVQRAVKWLAELDQRALPAWLDQGQWSLFVHVMPDGTEIGS